MKKVTTIIYVLAILNFFISNPMYSQFTQQGNKLTGTGELGSADQGFAVSISSDGKTAIVGGSGDNSGAGAVWIYTRTGGVWSQQGNKLVGTGAIGSLVFQGSSVSISSDGNTAIEGGWDDDSGKGAAWIFTRTGGVWTQQGSKLVGTGAVNNAEQGESVSLSGDGNTAIVGGYGDNSGAGAVWVYTRTAGIWIQQGSKLVGTGAANAAAQGRSVSLSSDGNTAIVGGVSDNNETNPGDIAIGAAWVYTRTGGAWTQQGSKLVGTGVVVGAYQGTSVSISSDGNTAIMGGWDDNSGAGAAWMFTRTGGVWTQQGSKLVGTGAVGGARQGWAVSLSSDGNKAIVGGWDDNSATGAVWVYTRTGGVWTQQGSKLVGTGAAGGADQGFSVSISSDGSTAIVGAPADNSSAGAVWVYQYTTLSAYCSSQGTNTTHGYIKKVSMETINNTSGNNGGYADFTAQSATLLGGATYTIELAPGFNPNAYVEYWTVYIDYNNNGVFEPSEIVGEKHAYIKVNKSFTIPATALNGATRMRIQMQAGSQETDPCATYTYGEVEDYTVVITGNPQRVAQTNSDFNNISEDNTNDFKLYPNPAKDDLTVEFTGSSHGYVKVNVYDLSGQKVMNIGDLSFIGSTIFNLNTSKLNPGFYIFEMEINGQRQLRKFLILR